MIVFKMCPCVSASGCGAISTRTDMCVWERESVRAVRFGYMYIARFRHVITRSRMLYDEYIVCMLKRTCEWMDDADCLTVDGQLKIATL